MKNKIIEFIRFLVIILLLILMIFSSIRITYGKFLLKSYSNHLIIIGILLLLIYIIDEIKNFKFNKYEIFIFLLMIFTSLSLLSSININISLFGKVNRFEGYYIIITYYLLILNCMHIKNKRYIKIIIFLILIYFFLNGIYGMYQVHIFHQPRFFLIKNSWKYAKGFLGNSMFYGSLSCIGYCLVLGIFLKEEKIVNKVICYILLLFSSILVVISGAMSSFVSIILVYAFIALQAVIKMIKRDREGLIMLIQLLFIIISFSSIFVFYMQNNRFLKRDISEIQSEYNSINNGIIEDKFGTGRVYIWKNTINKIIENRGVGVGIDSFNLAFDNKLIDVKSGLLIDKAHNEYLQKMLCEGIVSGILYIIFLLSIFFKNIKRNLSPIYYSLYLSFITYSIQAFFNISVTRVAPIYFIIIGLLIGDMVYEK